MKFLILFFILSAFSFAQHSVKSAAPKTTVAISIQEDNATSELPFLKMGMSPELKDAQFSSMYFGPKRKSDISFLILVVGSKIRYTPDKTWAIKIIINDIPLKNDRGRLVSTIKKDMGGDLIGFHVTTEEVAWMATGSRLSFSIMDADAPNVGRPDTITFTPTGYSEFKKFAESILLIRSQY